MASLAMANNMNGIASFGLRLALIGSVATLAACAEPQTYLTGKREDISSVYSDGPVEEPDAETVDRTEPVAIPGAVNNANWLQRPGSPSTRTSNAAFTASPSLIWTANIGAGDGRRGRITADPVVADGRVFALDSEAKVTAVSTGGGVVWSRDLVPARDNAGDASGGGLAYGAGKLFVTTGYGELTALDPATGAILWEQDLDAAGTGSPTVIGDLVYLVSGDSTAWAVETGNGRIRWQLAGTPDNNTLAGGPAPAVAGENVIFANASGEVQAVDRVGGLRKWGALVSGRRPGYARSVVTDISGDPVVANGRVYSGIQSGSMVALDAETGERLWSAKQGPMSSVWSVGNAVFLVSDRNELVRLDAETGEKVWGTELPLFTTDRPRRQRAVYPHHGPVMAGGRLVVASGDGVLRLFDPASGDLVGQAALPGGATTNPVVAGGTLYVVSARGQLHAFR